jgi:uncharacterized protein (TIGR00369 family)
MTTLHADLAFIQNVLDAAPFHRWLGMKAASIENDTLRLVVPWREELVSNPRLQSAHGGVLAAIIDLGGFYALIATGNMPAATADLRVDYHAPALPGTLLADCKVVRIGATLSVGEVSIRNEAGELLASGRGAYLMQRSKS